MGRSAAALPETSVDVYCTIAREEFDYRRPHVIKGLISNQEWTTYYKEDIGVFCRVIQVVFRNI